MSQIQQQKVVCLTKTIYLSVIHGLFFSTQGPVSSYVILDLIEYLFPYLTNENFMYLIKCNLAYLVQYTPEKNKSMYGKRGSILYHMGDFLCGGS